MIFQTFLKHNRQPHCFIRIRSRTYDIQSLNLHKSICDKLSTHRQNTVYF